ncbi:hypothetical protein [Hymenobacter sp. BT491]|uniref:hypothetical protein n=1 Tax=Hymenobacter sp. BT491 TaxID=2766779 RepID=UPI0016536E1A|nr:hypothetical protein [Hymenobacter sp. BT491]MBC6989505.1 hypothetical protein [Hymenobacter sp. BT491]
MKQLTLLLLGKRREFMQQLLPQVREAGFYALGSTSLATVHDDFDARDFDVIGLGGWFGPEERARMKETFRRQNPQIVVLDLVGPVALEQLKSFAAGRELTVAQQLMATFDGSLEVRFALSEASAVELTLYYYDAAPRAETLLHGVASAGETVLRISPEKLGQGPNFLVLKAENGDILTHRIEIDLMIQA